MPTNPRRRRRRRNGDQLATKGYVKSLLSSNIETKQCVGYVSQAGGISTTLHVTELYDLMVGSQGIGSDNFIGKEIRLQSLFMAMHLEQANTHPNGDVVRVMIVECREDYFPQTGNLSGIFFDIAHPLLSTPNYDTLSRVLYDRTFILNQPNNNHKEVLTKVNFQLKNQSVKFSTVDDGQPGAVNTMDRNLWLVMLSDSSISNSAHPVVNSWLKLRYKDA